MHIHPTIDPLIPVVLRVLAVYLFIVLAIRIFGRKELSQLSVTDLVFILLLSNAVQNAMVGENTTLQGGIAAAFTLFAVNYLFKKLLFRSRRLAEFIQGESTMLIYKGALQEAHLDRAGITHEELLAAVREHGVPDFAHVDLAVLEIDGNISIISNDFSKETISPSVKHPHFRHRPRPKLKKDA